MAKRSYVPRHAAVIETAGVARGAGGATRAASVLAASVGVAAATTALANPAVAAAHHAHTGVWDRVASCESGQRWHVDTGNGYYGGLQFSASTWHAYHGGKYATHADNATRMEQIQVARRVLKAQGRDAWPVCGPRAGLTKHSGYATAAALPDDPNRMPGDRSKGFTGKKTHTRKTHKSHAHKSHSHKSHTHKTHTHKSNGTHKSRSHHTDVYVVRRGDTLSSIAARKHVHGGWHALYRANRNRLHNPDVLHVGQHLLIP